MVKKRLIKYPASELLLGFLLGVSSVGDAAGAPVFHLWIQKVRVDGGWTVASIFPVSSALLPC